MSDITVSVVVISWNQVDFLRRLVGQLLMQDFDPDRYEVIVVDDGSTDGSREWLATQSDPKLKSVLGTVNRGRSVSRNSGIRVASGSVITMIDGDHTIRPDFVSVHAACHARERCVIVGKSDFVDAPDFRALNHYLNHCGAAKMPSGTRLPGRYFLTRNCSVPKDLLLQIGLFDERYTQWGGEDLDLGIRLENTGVPIYGEPAAIAIHHHLRPLNALLNQLYVYGRDGIPILIQTHPRLFTELNLHRALKPPAEMEGGNGFNRFIMRALCCSIIYHPLKIIANVFRGYHLPRAIFDYLHFRQYLRGYQAYLRASKRSA